MPINYKGDCFMQKRGSWLVTPYLDTALTCGFNDPSHLNRHFKRCFDHLNGLVQLFYLNILLTKPG